MNKTAMRIESGIMLDEVRIRSEMRKFGMQIDGEGVVFFYPLDDKGRPSYSERPMMIQSMEHALLQTERVINSIESQQVNGDRLQSGLASMMKFMARSGSDPRAVNRMLREFDVSVAPYIPSMRVRKPGLIALRGMVDEFYASVGSGMFAEAAKIGDSMLESVLRMMMEWEGQIEAWRGRRRLILAVRNMMRKNPEALGIAASTKEAVMARELVRIAESLVGSRYDYMPGGVHHGDVVFLKKAIKELEDKTGDVVTLVDVKPGHGDVVVYAVVTVAGKKGRFWVDVSRDSASLSPEFVLEWPGNRVFGGVDSIAAQVSKRLF